MFKRARRALVALGLAVPIAAGAAVLAPIAIDAVSAHNQEVTAKCKGHKPVGEVELTQYADSGNSVSINGGAAIPFGSSYSQSNIDLGDASVSHTLSIFVVSSDGIGGGTFTSNPTGVCKEVETTTTQPQHIPVSLCHKDGQSGNYSLITIDDDGQNYHGHGNHEGDIIPAPEGGCPADQTTTTAATTTTVEETTTTVEDTTTTAPEDTTTTAATTTTVQDTTTTQPSCVTDGTTKLCSTVPPTTLPSCVDGKPNPALPDQGFVICGPADSIPQDSIPHDCIGIDTRNGFPSTGYGTFGDDQSPCGPAPDCFANGGTAFSYDDAGNPVCEVPVVAPVDEPSTTLSGTLPVTGSNTQTGVTIALLALVAGAVLVLIARRRKLATDIGSDLDAD